MVYIIHTLEKVEELMATRKCNKHCLIMNVAQPEQLEHQGNVKVTKIYSNLVKAGGKEPELYDAIKDIPPEWWDEDTQIILNKDLAFKRNKDGNKEHSWLLWLGDFTGGALDFDDGIKIEEKYK
jgi:hypothetical protein